MNALNALRIHMRRYPQSEPQDWIKLLYQSEFGPGHFVEAGAVLARLKSEMAALAPREDLPLFVPEKADETVRFQVKAIADWLESLREEKP